MLNQDINLAQVNDIQYKFYMDEDIRNIVKPFNINIIKKELAVNSKSNLLVFLLDHEHSRGFSEISYQFIVERLLCIDCKHFYVFNDSNDSGSIIKLIKLSEEFLKIFPGIENSTLESALFYFLTNLNKIYSSDEQIMFNIDGTLDLIDDYDIDSSIKKVMKSKLQEIEVQMLPKISDFVLSLGYEFQSTGCVPHHFIQFAKKATIFTSSKFNQVSLTLPGRKFTYSLLDEWRIRIFGSIFSSILIETLLDKDSLITLEVFRDKIYDKYTKYKDKYIKYIKRQNEYIQGETNNSELPKEEEIENFFSPETYKGTHFFSSKNNFPKLYKILLEQKYWNIDITEVNSTEYNDVHFCNFKIYQPRSSKYNSNYGPVEEYYYMDKFMKDFKDAVANLFKEHGLQKEFMVNTSSQSSENIEKESCPLYCKFIGLIRGFIKSSNYGAIRLLKVPIAIYYDNNQDDVDRDAKIFANAFEQIIPYWDGIDLQ